MCAARRSRVALEAGIDLHLREGVWATLRADRLESSSNLGPVAFAVTIEPTPAADRASLFARVIGLTERESELLLHLVRGSDTRTLAHGLFMSEHTVQDHFKSIFAKAGLNSRRNLIARATGVM